MQIVVGSVTWIRRALLTGLLLRLSMLLAKCVDFDEDP
jgi:hypothetical protein